MTDSSAVIAEETVVTEPDEATLVEDVVVDETTSTDEESQG